MTPFQQLYLGLGAKKKVYLDDVFSTYLYKGTGTESGSTGQTINNGVDLSQGSMTWIKSRGDSSRHAVVDTVRGAGKMLSASENVVSTVADLTGVASFNSNGFTLGNESGGYQRVNMNNQEYSSWSFLEQEGFFDCVSYTGDGSSSGRQIAHNLGSVPGCIIVKCTSAANNWAVYHRGTDLTNPENYGLNLNNTNARVDNEYYWHDTKPTSTHFTIRDSANVNANGETYIAYVFAGGENTATTARSINFNGSSDYLEIADHADFDVGTNWTAECWFICEGLNSNGWDAIFGQWDSGYLVEYVGTELRFYNANTSYKVLGTTTGTAPLNQWHHVAISKQGSTTRVFLNGTQVVADFDMGTTSSGNPFRIGGNMGGGAGGYFNGQISNVRIVKGTAVYTSSFRPIKEPLTNITNTVLLCCNGSSVTGSTVTPGTITTPGSSAPNAYTNTPFDDPDAFLFGDAKEGIIKCGSYTGNGSSTGPEINLGWEPQWILIKNASASQGWRQFDSMRGIPTGGSDARLFPNNSDAESAAADYIDLTSTGFKIKDNGGDLNGNGNTIIYMAIRRPDGYVGKPADAGTDVFAMDTGAGGSTVPGFDSGFPVDFALARRPSSTDNWITYSRLTGPKYVKTDTNDVEGNDTNYAFDSNVGWYTAINNTYQSWMWKRHAGFDVVTYTGNGTAGHQIPHSLNKIPEMIWVKRRSPAAIWRVYHKSLNGGNSPEGYNIILNQDVVEASDTTIWNNSAPTSTHFSVGTHAGINTDDNTYIAMLFASVDGISKVGSFVIDGSQNAITVTTGFQPRFVIYKNIDTSYDWWTHDTVRGWGSGDDKGLKLNSDTTQSEWDTGAPTSTGFTLVSGYVSGNYIYYAHA